MLIRVRHGAPLGLSDHTNGGGPKSKHSANFGAGVRDHVPRLDPAFDANLLQCDAHHINAAAGLVLFRGDIFGETS